jgi:hypothetical protein
VLVELCSFGEFQFQHVLGKSNMLTRKFAFALVVGAFAFTSICQAGASLRFRLEDSATAKSFHVVVTDNDLGGTPGPSDTDPTLGRISVGGMATGTFSDITVVVESSNDGFPFGLGGSDVAGLRLRVTATSTVADSSLVVWAEDVYSGLAGTTVMDSDVAWSSSGFNLVNSTYTFQSWGDDVGGAPAFGGNGTVVSGASQPLPATPPAVPAWGPGEGTTVDATPPGAASSGVGFISDGGFYLAARIELYAFDSSVTFDITDQQVVGDPPPPPPIPEPTSIVLLAGVFGAFGLAKRRKLLTNRNS